MCIRVLTREILRKRLTECKNTLLCRLNKHKYKADRKEGERKKEGD